MRPLPLVALLGLVACRRAPSQPHEPARPSTAAPAPAPAAVAAPIYRVDPTVLDHPGVLRGSVRWSGPRPATAPMAVGPGGNPDLCGATQGDPTLVVAPDGAVANGSEPWRIPDVSTYAPIEHTFAKSGEPFQPYARDPETLARQFAQRAVDRHA